MSLSDDDYAGSGVYPKNIIGPEEMSHEERTFYDALIGALSGAIDAGEVAVEQRNGDYRTVVYKDWDNDFLRYHFGPDGFWASVRMYKPLMNYYEDSPLFAAQANKRQLHWRSSVKPSEISKLADAMTASCKGFFGEFDTEVLNKPKKSTAEKLLARIEELKASSKDLSQTLGDKPYTLFAARDIALAGSAYQDIPSSLVDGSVLVCKQDAGNEHDDQAVGVYDKKGRTIGYLPARGPVKKAVFEALSKGAQPLAVVINDGTDGGTRYKRKKIHVALIVQQSS